ncbi:MAG: RNase H-like domain-containing protein, partial [Cyanobacteria bacterium J06553_1]
SRLDVKSGYHKLRVAEADVEKTAFVCPMGQFEFLAAPFGLTNLPSQFSKMMANILQPIVGRFAVVYLDDVVIYSETVEDHLQHLRETFTILRANRIILNEDKTVLGLTRMAYLGFMVEDGHLSIDDGKMKAMSGLNPPGNVPELRSILGLFNYFRRFIKGYGDLIAPLSELLKKDKKFEWAANQEVNFEQLKQRICSAPVVQLVNPADENFTMITDASSVALGGVLMQADGVIAYESRKFTPTEMRYATHERELLAIVHCFKAWRHYLEGAKTMVKTDHASLKYLPTTFQLTPRMARMYEYLTRFDYSISYIKGTTNVVADVLSRPAGIAVLGDATEGWDEAVLDYLRNREWVGSPSPSMKAKVKEELHNFRYDEELEILQKTLENGQVRAWVPSVVRGDLIVESHRRIGHGAPDAVVNLLSQNFWWPTLRRDVLYAVRTCKSCQLSPGGGVGQKKAELHPLPQSRIFGRWHLDFIGRLPKTKAGNQWILVAVDSTTRWPVVEATKDATAKTVAEFVYRRIVLDYGTPEEILTDRGTSFIAQMMQKYLQIIGVRQTLTSAYHPRTNSIAERYNQTLGAILTKVCHGAVRRWDEFLPEALFATRVRVHRVTKATPFELLYGVKPRLPLSIHRPNVFLGPDEDMRYRVRAEELERKGALLGASKLRTEAAQLVAKRSYDEEVKRDDLEVGDHVVSTSMQRNKLEPKHLGPFRVESKRLFDTYQLSDPNGKLLKALVHRDRLKRVNPGSSVSHWWFKPSARQRKMLEGTEEDVPEEATTT